MTVVRLCARSGHLDLDKDGQAAFPDADHCFGPTKPYIAQHGARGGEAGATVLEAQNGLGLSGVIHTTRVTTASGVRPAAAFATGR